MAARRPVTDAERDQVRAMHADGASRNAIARALGRSPSTITAIADELGLSFNRERTAAATAAKQADNRARRAQLAAALLDDVERLRAQLFAPTTVYAFGGRDNVYREHKVDRPPPREQRDIVLAITNLIASHLRLVEYDRDTGADPVTGMLGALLADLQARHGTGPDDAPPVEPDQHDQREPA